MTDLVSYESDGTVATITMDDGKVNALSPAMLAAVDAALDRAEAEGAVVVLTGRDGIFSGGFDLRVMRSGQGESRDMVSAGFDLAGRVLAFPTPVVMAVPGHAIAMGLFLLLSGDYRIGARLPAKLTANEAAIGMTLPLAATEITRLHVSPSHYDRVLVLAEPFTPEQAVGIGLLDEVVEPSELLDRARAKAAQLAKVLDFAAHHGIKRLARERAIEGVRTSVEIFRTQGLV